VTIIHVTMSEHYYPLVNKLMTALRIRDQLAAPFFSHESSFIKPFITIAREPGSGGKPIAQAVAEKLGFTLVDEQIIDEIAHSTKKRKEIIKAIDEKARTRIEDFVHSFLNEEYVDDIKYVSELVRIILTYAHQGQVVILGRGANFMTPLAKGLHVNVVAPYDTRVLRAMEFEGHTKSQAKQVIAAHTAERENFVKKYFRQDINRPSAYDLVVNTQHFRINEARDVIVEAFYRKFSRSVRYGAIFKK
jgi:cytidylate kinase